MCPLDSHSGAWNPLEEPGNQEACQLPPLPDKWLAPRLAVVYTWHPVPASVTLLQ